MPSPFVQFTVGHKSFESKVNTLMHTSNLSLNVDVHNILSYSYRCTFKYEK